MRTALILFMIFPFTKILPIETYNQPYAFALSAILLAHSPGQLARMPRIDRLILTYMAALGLLLFLIASLSGVGLREVQYLLIYVSLLVMVPVTLETIRRDPERVRKLVTIGIVLWVVVGVIQQLVNPDFLVFLVSKPEFGGELGSQILASGRGVLSMAPEATHHGFQMLVLAAVLMMLRGPLWAAGLAVASALLLARSSSAMLAVLLGVTGWVLLRPKRWPLLLSGFALAFMAEQLSTLIFGETTRVGRLLRAFGEGSGDLLADYSVNARFYGSYAPIAESISHFTLPIGMRQDAWLGMRDAILFENPQIIDLSLNGPGSGYGILLVQAGFLGIPLFLYFIRKFWLHDKMTWYGIFPIIAFFVFLGQIYISSPSFSLLLAAVIYAAERERSGNAESQL